MIARDPETRIPLSLINRRTRERHYAIVAVSMDAGSPRTEYVYWCEIPARFQMCLWKLQPHTAPLCGRCMARADALGKEPAPGEEAELVERMANER